jgi:ribosomal protein S18 acetylase RimI-like enzyme
MLAIRRFREADRETLKAITVACFEKVSIDRNIEAVFGPIGGRDWRWRKTRHIDADIAANPDGVLVAEEDGQVVGYITARLDPDSKIGWIPNYAVSPARQKHGIGRRLMDAVLAYFREHGMEYAKIETLAQNEVGTRYYPKVGFREVARQVHYVMPLGGKP